MSDPHRDPILSWSPSGPPHDPGPPRRRLRWSILLVTLRIALLVWVVLGAFLLLAVLAMLGLESGNHPEHPAEFARLAGIWLVGWIVILGFEVMRRRTAPRSP